MFTVLPEEQIDEMMERLPSSDFDQQIEAMNAMYRLPITQGEVPTLHNLTTPKGDPELASHRLTGFMKTLRDELAEGSEIMSMLQIVEAARAGHPLPIQPAEETDSQVWKNIVELQKLAILDIEEAERVVLTKMADWFADMSVYLNSEALKYGIPLAVAQAIVMASNFTKLPESGIPLHDENGKFLKDMSKYVPPENALHSVIHNPDMYDEAEEDYDEDEEDEDSDSDD